MTSNSASTSQQEHGSLWRVLAVALSATLVGSAVLAGFLLYPQLFGKPAAVTERDRRVLIMTGDFERWSPSLIIRNDKEQITKTRYGEHEVVVAYRYDELLDERRIYVQSELRLFPDSQAAAADFREQSSATLPFDRVTRQPKNDQFTWGDQSEFGELHQDGEMRGRYFHGRLRNRVYTVVIYGVNTEFSSEFAELLTQALDRAAVYQP
ncbi:MAG: hypothetical protein RIC55_25560 [Pirellulaceae bacterium]